VIPRVFSGLVFAIGLTLVAAGAAAQQPGTLIMEGDYEGAEVYVDAELVGEMPLDPLSLESGNHTIRVSRGGYTEFTDVFRIRPRHETVVLVEMMAISMALTINTDPDGVQVFIDGNFAGETPLELELDEGEHSIRLKKFGFHEMLQTVESVAGQDETLDLALEALPQEELDRLTTPPEPSWYEKAWVWGVIGGGAVVAAVVIAISVYFATRDPLSQADEFCMLGPEGACIQVDLTN